MPTVILLLMSLFSIVENEDGGCVTFVCHANLYGKEITLDILYIGTTRASTMPSLLIACTLGQKLSRFEWRCGFHYL